MPEEAPTTEEATLHSAGPIPGIPGSHGPGRYLIDWLTRTITRIEDDLAPTKSEPVPAENTAAPTAADEIEEN